MSHPSPFPLSADVWAFAQASNKKAALATIYSKPKVFHIETTGSDTTGDGSRAVPFATAQKAYDVAIENLPCVLQFGVGSFGNVTVVNGVGWPEGIFIRGQGGYLSAIGTITGRSQPVTIRSDKTILVQAITTTGIHGDAGAAGSNSNGETGGHGQNGGAVVVSGGLVGTIAASGGDGGEGGAGNGEDENGNGYSGGDGGNAGTGGNVFINDSIVRFAYSTTGGAGTGGPAAYGSNGDGNPGGEGAPSNGGYIYATKSQFDTLQGYYVRLACSAYEYVYTEDIFEDLGGNAASVPFDIAIPWEWYV